MPAEKENPVINEKISPDFERKIAYLENLMVVVCDFKNGPKIFVCKLARSVHKSMRFAAPLMSGLILFLNQTDDPYSWRKGPG